MREVLVNAARLALMHTCGVPATHTAADGTVTSLGSDGLQLLVRLDQGREKNAFGSSAAVSEFWIIYCLQVDLPNPKRDEFFTLTDSGVSYRVKSDPTSGPQSVYWEIEVLA